MAPRGIDSVAGENLASTTVMPTVATLPSSPSAVGASSTPVEPSSPAGPSARSAAALNRRYIEHLATSLRARQRGPRSNASATTTSTQPVLVRAYSAASRPSDAASAVTRAKGYAAAAAATGETTMPKPTTTTSSNTNTPKLPLPESYTLTAILAALEPEIASAIDAIAGICAKSRMSMASEHSAHLPPQGEILDRAMATSGPAVPPQRQLQRGGFGFRAAAAQGAGLTRRLTAVPEASSSSERLAGGSAASSRSGGSLRVKEGQGAYGALRNIFSRGSASPDRKDVEPQGRRQHGWLVFREDGIVTPRFGEPADVKFSSSPVLSCDASVSFTGSPAPPCRTAVDSLNMLLRPPTIVAPG